MYYSYVISSSQSDEDQVAASVKSTVGEDASVNQVNTAVIPKGTFEEISNGSYFLSSRIEASSSDTQSLE